MRIGIFTKVFERPTIEDVFDACVAHDVHDVQLSLSSAGLDDMPDVIATADAQRIGRAAATRGVAIAGLSGTFNMIDPDRAARRDGLRRLAVLAEACPALGASFITLCTGTRDRESMWRRHPDNDTGEAWTDLVASVREALRLTEGTGATLAFEPEVANVVDSAPKARRLLDEVDSARLKVVIDGANVFHTGELPRQHEILEEAFRLLGRDIAFAHAKDIDHDGAAGHLPAGHGLLDYRHYIRLLRESGFDGAVVLHGLSEADVPGCVSFLTTSGV